MVPPMRNIILYPVDTMNQYQPPFSMDKPGNLGAFSASFLLWVFEFLFPDIIPSSKPKVKPGIRPSLFQVDKP